MDIKKYQNVNFCASSHIWGPGLTENAEKRLTEALNACGNNNFTHIVNVGKRIIATGSYYKEEDKLITLSGPIEILRESNETENDLVNNVLNFVRDKVSYFKSRNKIQ